jgi:hypothetical protein
MLAEHEQRFAWIVSDYLELWALELDPASVVADLPDRLQDVEELVVAAKVLRSAPAWVLRIVESASPWRAASSGCVIASK